jgi:PAS domain S-box-containing protein
MSTGSQSIPGQTPAPPAGEDMLHGAAEAVSMAEGDTAFRDLVRYLARSLQVDVAFIALPHEADRARMRMAAFYADGRLIEDFEYPLAGTPCETVMGQTFRLYPTGLRDRFPLDADFRAMALDAYAGYPMSDARGEALGLIAVASRRPFASPPLVESTLKILAARVAGELERRRAEAELRASEARYRQLFEMESDAILLIDVATLRIVDANRAASALYGYTREELLALTAADLSMQPEVTASTIRAHTGPGRVPLRHHRRKDGSAFPVEIANNTLELGGRPTLLAAIRDVTERQQAEEARMALEAQLRQAQKMEAIGHLSGGVAHDFNNILTSVMGYVALAADRPAAQADAKLEHYLEQAQSAVQRARELIRQMLTFSRGQRGEPRAVSLPQLVAESSKLLRSTLPTSVELITQLAPDLPPTLIDPVHLEQVLLTLCINARDAMQAAGTIRVTLGEARFAGGVCASCRNRIDGTFLVLGVSDSGSGIDPATMDRMFEPFFTTKEVGKGSGMGLATVHGIVHEYGGHVCVQTAPGAGATFQVLLPPLREGERTVPGSPGAAAAAPPGAHRLEGRVLVVDDDDMVASLLEEMLAGWGLAAKVCRSPLQALQWFEQDPAQFDLVLTDYTMPKMTGVELARQLTQLAPELPVLLYSGYGSDIDPDQAARSGVCALVAKPVEPGQLFALLRDHLPAASHPAH